MNTAFAKVATGALPISGWDTLVAEIKSIGIDEAIGIQQAAIERFYSRK